MTKMAIVTGGNRGIGLGIASALARESWNLALCATRDEADCWGVLTELRKHGTEVRYYRVNLADATSRKEGLEAIGNDFETVQLLVNNAGVAPLERRDMREMTLESYRRVMQINLEGPLFFTQAVANRMIEQKHESNGPSAIVNISSISATVASTSRGEYCLSKAGVSMATQLWAVCLAEYGIPVYEVRPGIIKTDMTEAVQEKYDKLIAAGLVPQKRWGMPDDVGRVVAMLARGDLPYSTGQVILVDGGQLIPRL